MATHLTFTGTKWRPPRSQPHLLLFAMALIFSMAAGHGKTCTLSEDCAFSIGEGCHNGTCICVRPPCEHMSPLPFKCREDVECVQLVSFSQCMRQSCFCLPGYRPVSFGRACELITSQETSTPSSSWIGRPNSPYRPTTDTDYSGVVKMALGAAIVMLAGVILALVWNMYRERRRSRRGGVQSLPNRTRRNQRANRRPHRGTANSSEVCDNPPRYDDVFFISATEPGRRYEKPPSYEDALRDQQIPIVSPPAYLNLAFSNDLPPAVRYYQPIPMPAPSQEISIENSANSSGSTTIPETNILNVNSIINRLRPNRTSTTNSGASSDAVPICTLRRTKSGRAPDDIRPVQCENLVDQTSVRRSNSTPAIRIDQPRDTSSSSRDASINIASRDSQLDPVAAHYKQTAKELTSIPNVSIVIENEHSESTS